MAHRYMVWLIQFMQSVHWMVWAVPHLRICHTYFVFNLNVVTGRILPDFLENLQNIATWEQENTQAANEVWAGSGEQLHGRLQGHRWGYVVMLQARRVKRCIVKWSWETHGLGIQVQNNREDYEVRTLYYVQYRVFELISKGYDTHKRQLQGV